MYSLPHNGVTFWKTLPPHLVPLYSLTTICYTCHFKARELLKNNMCILVPLLQSTLGLSVPRSMPDFDQLHLPYTSPFFSPFLSTLGQWGKTQAARKGQWVPTDGQWQEQQQKRGHRAISLLKNLFVRMELLLPKPRITGRHNSPLLFWCVLRRLNVIKRLKMVRYLQLGHCITWTPLPPLYFTESCRDFPYFWFASQHPSKTVKVWEESLFATFLDTNVGKILRVTCTREKNIVNILYDNTIIWFIQEDFGNYTQTAALLQLMIQQISERNMYQ